MATTDVTYLGGHGNPISVPNVSFPVAVGMTITVDANQGARMLADSASWTFAGGTPYVPPASVVYEDVFLADGVLSKRGADGSPATVSAGGSSALTVTATKTAAYTAAVGELVRVDSSGRQFLNATTVSGQLSLVAAGAAFTNDDVGRGIGGPGIAAGATIASVTNSTTAVMSINATASSSTATINVFGPPPVTLPAGAADGARVAVKKMDAGTNAVTVLPAGSDTIDGLASVSLRKRYETRAFVMKSGTWVVSEGLSPRITPASGSRIVASTIALGDSLTVGPSGAPTSTYEHLVMLSGGRVFRQANAGIGGQSTPQMLARLDTDVIALNPGRVIYWAGTNNNPLGQNLSLAQGKSDASATIDQLLAADIPIEIWTVLPRGASGITAGVRTHILRTNASWKQLARAKRIPFFDAHAVAVDPATGLFKSGYSADSLHLTPLGCRVLAQAYLAQFGSQLPASPIDLAQSALDTENLIGDGLFQTDTNADGVPDLWTGSFGSAGNPGYVHSLDNAAAGEYIGKGMSITQQANPSIRSLDLSISSSSGTKWAINDTLAFSGIPILECESGPMVAGGGNIIRIRQGGVDMIVPVNAWSTNLPSGAFYREFTLPAITSIAVTMIAAQGTGKMTVAQLTLRNLTQQAAAGV